MSHTISYNSEAHLIEAKIQGDVTFNEVKKIFTEVAQFVKEKKCVLFLGDYREATVKLSTIEIYELPVIFSDLFASLGLDLSQLKRAIVVEKNLKDFAFFETVTTNRGQNAKLFHDIDEAKKWLSEK